MISILMATNTKTERSNGMPPLIIGLSIGAVGISMGSISGFSLNPARDLGPRMFTAIMYGRRVFEVRNYFFWIPTFIPFGGAILGTLIYRLCIDTLIC